MRVHLSVPISKLLLSLALSAAVSAFAQSDNKLQPLPDVPPPPPGINLESDLEPQVTIIKKGEDKVEEYRINGQLYMMRVTPASGPSYYLVDEEGKGQWARRDTIGANVKPPMWLIKSW